MDRGAIDGSDSDLTIAERIGKASMELLDHIAAEYPEGTTLETVGVVVALHVPQGAEVNGEVVESGWGRSSIAYYVEDPRAWVQSGLFAAAHRMCDR